MRPPSPRPARGVGPARFFGTLALAVLVEAALARRFDLIDGPTLMVTLIVVLGLALIALVSAVVAFRDIWREGAPGFGAALLAFVATTLTLAPYAGAAAGAVLYPPLDEVSTDLADRPIFHNRGIRPVLPIDTLAPVEDYEALQRAAYPDILPRTVPLSTVEAHALAHQTLVELGWTVTAEGEPAAEGESGWIDAEARSLILGLPYDVAIRVTADGAGSRIDVRSGSRVPAHDLGENARRIRSFYATLDDLLKRPAQD